MTETDEKVLCVPASAVETMMECGFHADDTLEALLRCKTYRNRKTPNDNGPPAEDDERYRQLIPCIVVVNSKGQILAYNRGSKGGEKRLASKWAIGFGGYVKIEDRDWRWHIGLDAEASRLLNTLYEGGTVSLDEMSRIVGLFRLRIADDRLVIDRVKGRPIYLGLAMTAGKRVRMKPQNLLTNLPLVRAG